MIPIEMGDRFSSFIQTVFIQSGSRIRLGYQIIDPAIMHRAEPVYRDRFNTATSSPSTLQPFNL
jgi:hypothetical protein